MIPSLPLPRELLATLAAQARLLEEPRLAARFGAEFAAYRAAVPGWIPRPPARA